MNSVPDVDLTLDPFADDLSAQLAAKAPRPRATRTTLALGGLVLAVAGFVGGVITYKQFGTPASPAGFGQGPALGAGQNPGGFGGRGGPNATQAPGGGGAAGAATTGTVKLIDGTTIYLTTPDGQTVTVRTSSTTSVRTEQATALTDVPVGATVSVRGTTAEDGTVTATTVTTTK